jgi:hypothetical protein
MNRRRRGLRNLLICLACLIAGAALGDRIGHSNGEDLRRQIPTGPHDGLPELGPAMAGLDGVVFGALVGLSAGMICIRLLQVNAKKGVPR